MSSYRQFCVGKDQTVLCPFPIRGIVAIELLLNSHINENLAVLGPREVFGPIVPDTVSIWET